MPNYSKILGNNILRELGRMGINQKMLAERAGLAPPVISRIISGDMKNPELRTLESIAHGLESTVSRLLRLPDERGEHTIADCYRAIGEYLTPPNSTRRQVRAGLLELGATEEGVEEILASLDPESDRTPTKKKT